MSNYMEQVGNWLHAELTRYLDAGRSVEAFRAFEKAVKDKILESYRNGLAAGQSKPPARVKSYPSR